ncbi:MAG: oligosaccharide flippase family protein [bacterium]|nr:oligosaccharide flippase family protein [bacterium]MBU1917405.1 oligosaccharide flippase family protein [bacterium]
MVTKHFKTLSKDMFAYGVMGMVSRGVGVLLLPVFSRLFSVAEYGVIDIVATFVGLISTFSLLCLPSALTRYFHDKRASIASQYSTVISFVIVLCFIVLSISYIFSDLIASIISDQKSIGAYIFLGAGISCFVSLNRLPDAILRMQKRIVAFNILNILTTVIYALGAVFLVVVMRKGLMGVFLVQLFAYAFQFTLGLILTRKLLTKSLNFRYLKDALKFCVPMFPATFVSMANRQVNRIIVVAMLGLSGVGLFGAGAQIASVVLLFVSIFQLSWVPFSMEILYHEDRNVVYKKSLQYYLGVFIIFGIMFSALAPEVIWLIVPPEYSKAYLVIPWLVGAAVFHGAANIVNLGASITEKTFINTIASWTGFIVNIIISMSLINWLGILGAAIGMFAAEIIFNVLLWRNTEKFLDIKYDRKMGVHVLFVYTVFSFLIIGTTWALDDFYVLSLISRLIVAVCSISFVAKITIDEMGWLMIKKIPYFIKSKLNYSV